MLSGALRVAATVYLLVISQAAWADAQGCGPVFSLANETFNSIARGNAPLESGIYPLTYEGNPSVAVTADRLPTYLAASRDRLSAASIHENDFIEVGELVAIIDGKSVTIGPFTSHLKARIKNSEFYAGLLEPGTLERLADASSVYHVHSHPGKEYFDIAVLLPSRPDRATYAQLQAIFEFLSYGGTRFKNMVVPVCASCNYVFHAQGIEPDPVTALNLFKLETLPENTRKSRAEIVRAWLRILLDEAAARGEK